MASPKFDLVVYGATGFTGRLVAEYLAAHYKGDGSLKWAMAGRSKEKLATVRDEIGAPKDLPLIVADASDQRVPEIARACVAALGAQLRMLKGQILEFDRRITARNSLSRL